MPFMLPEEISEGVVCDPQALQGEFQGSPESFGSMQILGLFDVLMQKMPLEF